MCLLIQLTVQQYQTLACNWQVSRVKHFYWSEEKTRLTKLHRIGNFQNKLLKTFCWTVWIELFDISKTALTYLFSFVQKLEDSKIFWFETKFLTIVLRFVIFLYKKLFFYSFIGSEVLYIFVDTLGCKFNRRESNGYWLDFTLYFFWLVHQKTLLFEKIN